MSIDTCCTCATLLTDTKVPYSEESEKPILFQRTLECCDRIICASCQYHNPRFQTYCPFCQISSGENSIPATGLRLPPAYSGGEEDRKRLKDDLPPAYATATMISTASNPPPQTKDTVHYLSRDDSIQSVSLAYQVPAPILRSHNGIFDDHLLAARKWILIPQTHYRGPPLSTPPDPEEEERKNKVRRWMVATKCPEYNIATLYLRDNNYDLNQAVDVYISDEQWDKDHPISRRAPGLRNGALSS